MTERRNVLTPEALAMVDVIARTGSFAAAARELGKVPSALTYSVRQLEEALDVLLFDRRSRQARLTAAGEELLEEGRRLLQEMDAVANRVRRVASGWESQLCVAVDSILSSLTVFELCEAFYALNPPHGPGTRLRLRSEVLAGTWEALVTGVADLAIGISAVQSPPSNITMQPLGELKIVYVVAPHHPLTRTSQPLSDAELVHHRAVAVADSAQRLTPLTVNLLPGQDVFTVPSVASKLEAILRGLGGGFLPETLVREHVEVGRLVVRQVERPRVSGKLFYAWRLPPGSGTRSRARPGLALEWWLAQLERPATRTALLERHSGWRPGLLG
ncbi:LysR substrate-binding domain-containing protein [Aquabacterium sp. A7-Y]|uniref:LysR substrate-binding domain-containing protein n=1 Tax=Aquabacterium sp. A7-Y TaxID=1349605 RepID=UPI00223CB1A5|nr:LysR substrate-binding domain-containing protein [Aquabacterium sp. A7-Y]MCW7536481.1 LysR substrate-binding domain-containing protein [Aquabacterium sp. A7-Y]